MEKQFVEIEEFENKFKSKKDLYNLFKYNSKRIILIIQFLNYSKIVIN